MAEFKRKPPSLAVRLIYCFLLDYAIPPMLRRLEKSDRLDGLLRKLSDKRERHIVRNNPFRNYVPGKQDVFVMTYAKSGTNWMLQIAWQLIHHCRKDFDHIHSVVPWPDAVLNSRTMRNYAIPLAHATAWQTAPERKRLIKTHLNWDLLPYSSEARYIAVIRDPVIRDPKDVFVSLYHFLRESLLGRATPSVNAMCGVFAAGKSLGGASWAANAAGYWAQRRRPNVLVLSFAEMKRDLEGTVRRVAAFLDIRASDELVQEVCRRSSFHYMKSIDERFSPYRGAPWRRPTRMMRRGRQGTSAELLSPEQQQEIDASCMAELTRLRSDLPYAEICGRLPPAYSFSSAIVAPAPPSDCDAG